MSQLTLLEPIQVDTTEVGPLGNDIVAQCKAMAVINSAESAEAAGQIIKAAAEVKKRVLAYIDPICETANKAHKAATGLRNQLLAFEKDVKDLSQRLAHYICEQKRIADQARLEAERKAQAEAEAQRRAIEEERLAEAARLEFEGKKFAAQEALKQAQNVVVTVAPVAPVHEPTKIVGFHTRDNWTWSIIDEAQIPREFLKPNDAVIGAYVRSHKGDTSIPGIRVINEPIAVNQR